MRLDLIAIGLLAILAIGGVGYANYTTSNNQAPIMADRYGYSYSTPTWTPTYTGPVWTRLQPGRLFNISYSFDEYPLRPNLETYIRIKITSKLNETVPLTLVDISFFWFYIDNFPHQQWIEVKNLGDIQPSETRIIIIPIKIWGNVTEGTYSGHIQIISQRSLGGNAYAVIADGKDMTVEVKKEGS
jgi:hypothetical protein